MEFPTLYGNVSRGDKVKVWNISVVFDTHSNIAKIIRSYGQQNGKHTESIKEVSKGKNVGKKNETSAYMQACNEAKSMWTKQKESGYVESLDMLQNSKLYLPMLAHDYTKRSKSIVHDNAYVQPKLDGVRLLVTNTAKISRTGKSIEILQHLDKELNVLFSIIGNDIALDGEIFTFDLPFETLAGCFRQTKHIDQCNIEKLKFYVFDCFSKTSDPGFVERYKILENAFGSHKFKYLQLICTEKLNSDVETYNEKYIKDGYEGVIIRNGDGKYKCNYRSVDLQKYKTFTDDEYVIVDAKEATGNDSGTAIFICKDNKSETIFAVRPRGSRALRAEYLTNKYTYIGKKLTVRYQNLSEYGVPRFPVGISVRDYE